MSKLTGLIAGVCMILSAVSANAEEISRRALAEELLTVMNAQESIDKYFAMAKQMLPAQMEKMKQAMGQSDMPSDSTGQTEKIMDLMAQALSWNKIKDDYITLYSETFSEEEMKGIIAFYKSPEGQAFINKQPELMKRSMELNQKLMIQIMPKVQAIRDELKQTAPDSSVREKTSK